MSDELQVRRDYESPPNRWRFTVPETGATLVGEYFKDLYQKVRQHRNANGLPEMAREEIEDGACRETNPGPSWCGSRPKKIQAGQLPFLTLTKVGTFLRSVMGAIREGKLVDAETAQKRFATCLQCPMRLDVGGCAGCHGISRLMDKLVAKNPIQPPEDGKNVCGACGCVISVKVHLTDTALDYAEKQIPLYHSSCWRLKENRPKG